MEQLSLDYFLNCGQDYLYITVDKEPQIVLHSKAAIMFIASNCLRYVLSLFTSNEGMTKVLLGNHFELWGDVLLWTLLTINISVVILSLLLISAYFKLANPDTLVTMATPLQEFLKKKLHKKTYYRIILKGSLISVVMFCMLPVSCNNYAVLIDTTYSEDFIPLVVSSVYIYALAGLSSYSGCVLSTVAIFVDIMCLKLRRDFEKLE